MWDRALGEPQVQIIGVGAAGPVVTYARSSRSGCGPTANTTCSCQSLSVVGSTSVGRVPRISIMRARRKSLKDRSVSQKARVCQRKPSCPRACGAIRRRPARGCGRRPGPSARRRRWGQAGRNGRKARRGHRGGGQACPAGSSFRCCRGVTGVTHTARRGVFNPLAAHEIGSGGRTRVVRRGRRRRQSMIHFGGSCFRFV